MPQSSRMEGAPSRFSNDSNNTMLPVVLVLFLFAMFFMNNNAGAPARREQDMKGDDQ